MSGLKKSRYFITFGLLSVIALMLLAIGPTYTGIKIWRAQRLAVNAVEHMENGDYKKATELARSAYELYPLDASVCRAVAQLYNDSDPAKAFLFWDEAYNISKDVEDLKSVVEYALSARKLEIAEERLLLLESLQPDDVEVLFWRADFLLHKQKIEEALQIAKRIVTYPDAPRKSHFFYIQISQFSEDPQLRQEGVDYLRKLSQRKDDLGLDSLRNLAEFDENTLNDVRKVVELFRAHPLATREDLLIALKIKKALPGEETKQILAEAKALFDLEDLEEVTKLGRWLNQQKLHFETINLVEYEVAMKRQDLFLVLLDAMAMGSMWVEIGEKLSDPSIPIDNYLRLLFEARVGIETGRTHQADIAWSRAKLSVANEPKKLWYLANYAKQLNLVKEARSVLDRLTEIPSTMRKAYEELIRMEQKQGDTRRLRDTFDRMASVYPNDVAVVNDLAYTNLLLNENVESSLETAEELVDLNPKYLANRITLALGLYRAEDHQKALNVLQDLPIDWAKVKVGWRAVYAAILRDNGKDMEASDVLSRINPAFLLPEEKRLLSAESAS